MCRVDSLPVQLFLFMQVHTLHEYVNMALVGLARTVCAHAVYDRMFDQIPARIPYTHRTYMVLANPRHLPSYLKHQ
jgi:hypothetical protein